MEGVRKRVTTPRKPERERVVHRISRRQKRANLRRKGEDLKTGGEGFRGFRSPRAPIPKMSRTERRIFNSTLARSLSKSGKRKRVGRLQETEA